MAAWREEVVPACLAGGLATALGHPLDTVKTHQQVYSSPGAMHSAATMLRSHGPSVFFRGMAPPMLDSMLMNTIMFVVFAEVRSRLPEGSTAASLLAGALAGMAQAFVGTPLDLAKVQAQLRGGSTGVTGVEVFMDLLRRSPGKLYRGHVCNLAREVRVGRRRRRLPPPPAMITANIAATSRASQGVFTAVYLGLYSRIRDNLVASEGSMPLHLAVLASATTGAGAWLACYPFDSVKTVQQGASLEGADARASPMGAARSLAAKGGVGAFYRGAGASVVRAMMVTGTRMLAYEGVRGVLASPSGP